MDGARGRGTRAVVAAGVSALVGAALAGALASAAFVVRDSVRSSWPGAATAATAPVDEAVVITDAADAQRAVERVNDAPRRFVASAVKLEIAEASVSVDGRLTHLTALGVDAAALADVSLPDGAVVLTKPAAQRVGVGRGAQVDVAVNGAPVSLRVAAVVDARGLAAFSLDGLDDGANVIMNPDTLARVTDVSSPVLAVTNRGGRAATANATRELYTLLPAVTLDVRPLGQLAVAHDERDAHALGAVLDGFAALAAAAALLVLAGAGVPITRRFVVPGAVAAVAGSVAGVVVAWFAVHLAGSWFVRGWPARASVVHVHVRWQAIVGGAVVALAAAGVAWIVGNFRPSTSMRADASDAGTRLAILALLGAIVMSVWSSGAGMVLLPVAAVMLCAPAIAYRVSSGAALDATGVAVLAAAPAMVALAEIRGAHLDARLLAIVALAMVVAGAMLVGGMQWFHSDEVRIVATATVPLGVMFTTIAAGEVAAHGARMGADPALVGLLRHGAHAAELVTLVLGLAAVGFAAAVRPRVRRQAAPRIVAAAGALLAAGVTLAVTLAGHHALGAHAPIDLAPATLAIVTVLVVAVAEAGDRAGRWSQSSRLARATSPNHLAEGLGVRANVARSTSTSPNRGL